MEYKGYMVKSLGTFPMLSIHSKGAGVLPVALKGMFTGQREAEMAIDGYLEGLKKGGKNGSTKGSRTG